MKGNVLTVVKLSALGLLLAMMAYSSTAWAKRPGGGGGSECPRDILCPDVMAPVICSNGQVYANACYAYQQCATDCVPTGDI